MPDALIIGYGVTFDDEGRVLLLHRRPDHPPWADHWWAAGRHHAVDRGARRDRAAAL